MNLLKAASTVSLLTLASRITGLLRDLLQASVFGASALTDAFNVAFRIPNLLRRLVGEGAFSQAFVPLLAAAHERDGDAATQRLIDAVATVLLWTLVVICTIGIVGAPLLVWLMGEGLRDSGGYAPAVVMTRWMFPYIACMSLVALAAGILNTWRRFMVPAATPVLLNLAWIAALVLGVPLFRRWGIEPIYALAAGVMIGGVLQLAVQVPALKRIGALPRFGLTWRRFREAWAHEGVHDVLRKMAPALLGVSVAQISQLINTQIASQIGAGAVSLLTYADRLMEFPTALLGVALGVVLTPQLSAAHTRKDEAAYSALLEWGLRQLLLVALPCAMALLVFAEPLVATLYQRGAFAADPGNVRGAAAAVVGYGVGLIGIVSIRILAPGYFARQDTRTPVRIAVGVLVLTQLFNLVFVFGAGLGIAGLALSTSLGALVNAGTLLFLLWRRGQWRPAPGWLRYLMQLVAASAAMGAGLSWLNDHLDWAHMRELVRIGWMAAALGGAAVVYFGTLALSGLRPKQWLRRG